MEDKVKKAFEKSDQFKKWHPYVKYNKKYDYYEEIIDDKHSKKAASNMNNGLDGFEAGYKFAVDSMKCCGNCKYYPGCHHVIPANYDGSDVCDMWMEK